MKNESSMQHLGEEDDMQDSSLLPKMSREQTPHLGLYRRLFFLLLAGNVLSVAGMLFSYRVHSVQYEHLSPTSPAYTSSPFGKIPSKLVTFEHDHAFDGSPLQRNSPWDDMNPPGNGFIVVQNPALYNLAPGTPLDQPYRNGYVSNGTIPEAGYLPSVFHQLHCMALIKSSVFELQRAGGEAILELKIKADQPPKKTIHGVPLDHLDHCIEFVRQALMCAGDTTLEPAEFDDDGQITHSSSGWGTQHMCKDWDYIYSYSFEHRVSDVTGITG